MLLWISGELAGKLVSDAGRRETLVRFDGAIFVSVTAVLLYLWLRWVRRIESELRESELQMSRLLEFAPDAILIHDARRILHANPAFFKLLEIPQDADVSKIRLRDITDSAYLPTMRARVARLASEAGIAGATEIRFKTLTGNLVEVEHASCSVHVGGRILVQSHLRDLTDRNHAWRELQRWNDELDARVRERTAELTAANKALESFTYSVAHDLRSPVGRMNGFATVLLESIERQDHAKAPHFARRVVDNARMMSDMIDGMLLLSRTDRTALECAPIDTAALVQSCVAQLDEAAANAIDVQALPNCRGDRALVREIWGNLIANAVKYSARSLSPKVVLSGEEVDGECRFCVADNGIGFDESETANLFRTFHRLPNAQGFAGTGIGLSVVKRIVTRHGGRVWAHGKPGDGAQFHFTLPAGQNL
jgi:signal transduction histidine kinase